MGTLSRKMAEASVVSKTSIVTLGLLLVSTFVVFVPFSSVSAQTQYVTSSPGYINLGMNTTIEVTAPSSGTYSIVVQAPNGAMFTVNENFASSGEVQNITFGNSTTGFDSAVDQVGTYKVFLENGTSVISSTSFYATNKLNVFMDMVDGGNCAYINGAPRGVKMFPRFYVSYASNGALFTNNTPGAYVIYTDPDGTLVNATWHKPNTVSQSSVGFFIGKYQISWNDTNVGPWNPNATIGDAYGNVATYHYIGSPFVITPATLDTNVTIVNSVTNETLSGLANGTSATVYAVISYPASAEPVPGFVAPLDSANRGGAVSAEVGWGDYNVTSGTFGGGDNPGGQIAQVSMTYTGHNGVWEANFTSNSVPAITPGLSYEIVVTSKDNASPANTGFAALSLGPASSPAQSSTTSTSQASTSQSQASTGVASIPLWAYAGTTIALIVGVIVGFLARRPK